MDVVLKLLVMFNAVRHAHPLGEQNRQGKEYRIKQASAHQSRGRKWLSV